MKDLNIVKQGRKVSLDVVSHGNTIPRCNINRTSLIQTMYEEDFKSFIATG